MPSGATHRAAAAGFFALVLSCSGAGHSADAQKVPSAGGPIPGAPVTGEAGAGALPPGVIELTKVNIVDEAGFGRPMTALTALIPASWSAQGGAVWLQQANGCDEPVSFSWAAMSPDGMSRFELFPTQTWGQSFPYPIESGCTQAAFTSTQEYLQAYVAQRFPNAQVIDFRLRPEFAEAAIAAAQAREQQFRNAGFPNYRVWAEGGELLYAFNVNGVDMRGVAAVTAIFYTVEAPNPMGGEPFRTVVGGTLGTFGAQAPNGQLDFTLMDAVRKSITPAPEWLLQYMTMKTGIGEIQTQGVAQTAAIIVAGGAAMTRATIEANQAAVARGYANLNRNDGRYPSSNDGGYSPGGGYSSDGASDDRMHRETLEAVRGIETYHEPVEGGVVELDATYDHAWRTRGGNYLLTNDPNFNPAAFGLEAQQLQVVQ